MWGLYLNYLFQFFLNIWWLAKWINYKGSRTLHSIFIQVINLRKFSLFFFCCIGGFGACWTFPSGIGFSWSCHFEKKVTGSLGPEHASYVFFLFSFFFSEKFYKPTSLYLGQMGKGYPIRERCMWNWPRWWNGVQTFMFFFLLVIYIFICFWQYS